MSIHKSQGSEFNDVLIILDAKDSSLLSKELIYTAITRAKTSLTLWHEPRSHPKRRSEKTSRTSSIASMYLKSGQEY